MTILELNIHLPIIISIVFGGTVLVDFLMSNLQRKDEPWRIDITTEQALFQMAVLFMASGLGYAWGFDIGSSLPLSQPHEPFLFGGVFAFILTIISRGYTMLHFHTS